MRSEAERDPDHPESKALLGNETFFRSVISSIFATDDGNGDGFISWKEYWDAMMEFDDAGDGHDEF